MKQYVICIRDGRTDSKGKFHENGTSPPHGVVMSMIVKAEDNLQAYRLAIQLLDQECRGNWRYIDSFAK